MGFEDIVGILNFYEKGAFSFTKFEIPAIKKGVDSNFIEE